MNGVGKMTHRYTFTKIFKPDDGQVGEMASFKNINMKHSCNKI